MRIKKRTAAAAQAAPGTRVVPKKLSPAEEGGGHGDDGVMPSYWVGPLKVVGGRLGEDGVLPVMDALIPAPAMEGIDASPWSGVDDGWCGDGRRRRG